MTLAQPAWLLLLPLLAVLLYLHRQRRAHRELEVSGLHLWRQLAVQHAPTRARRLPRFTPALLLQALVLLLLILALARPGFSQGGSDRVHTIILLDASRAMQARDGAGTRFAAARGQAADLLRGRVSVLLVGGQVQPLAVRRTDLEVVGRVLRQAQPGDSAPDWSAAANLAEKLTVPGEQTRYLALVSASEAVRARIALAHLKADVRDIGASLNNAALMSATLGPDAAGRLVLRGAARAFGAGGSRSLLLTLDGRALAQSPLRLIDGQETPFQVVLPPKSAGVLRVRLDLPDALSADDGAQFVLPAAPAQLRVMLVGPPEAAVERALRAIPGVVLSTAQAMPSTPDAADLLVVTDPAIQSAPPVSTLWLNARPARPTSVVEWSRDHPLAAGLPWAGVQVRQAAGVMSWADGTALLSGPADPLIEAHSLNGRREVRLNFDLASSDLTRSPLWPAFMLRVARWVQPEVGRALPVPCAVGERCPLPAGPGDLRGPDGARLSMSETGFIPQQAGVYTLGGQPLAVNRPAGPDADLRAAGGLTGASSTLTGANRRFWPILIGLALALIVAEALLARRERRRAGWRPLLGALVPAVLLLLALLDLPLPWPDRSLRQVALLAPDGLGQAPAGVPAVRASADLSQSLQLAAAALPGGAAGQVLLAPGGWADSARLAPVLAELRTRRVQVDPLPAVADPPAQIVALSAPSRINAGQTFELSLTLRARQPGPADLTLSRADEVLYQARRELRAGVQRLNLPLAAGEAGPGAYTLSLRMDGAAVRASLAVQVRAPATALLVGRDPAAAEQLDQALAIQNREAERRTPAQLPDQMAGLARYGSVALLDVSARDLSAAQRAALEGYVRGGGQLLIGGGPASFGPGGYYGTPLETLSPLSSRVLRGAPKVALGLVLDKSGSMNEQVEGGFTKLDLIKAAALAAADLLHPQSDVAVVAFDTSPKLAVPLQPAANRAVIRSQIGRIEAEGGTVVLRALEATLRQLGQSNAASKHMILLTDGIDGGIFSQDTYRLLVGRVRASGITLSSVAVGSGMHVPLMRNLATWGGGHFYQTSDWREVPGLLAGDTLTQGPPSVERRPASLDWTSDAPLSPGQVPAQVGGYVRTTLKPEATLLAQTEPDQKGERQPLVATWRVGLGQVTAVASGISGGWASDWAALPGYPALMSRLLRGGETDQGRSPVIRLEVDGPALIVRVPRAAGELQRQVSLDGPTGTRQVTLRAQGAELEARIEGLSAGAYLARDAAGHEITASLLAPTSDPALLRRVALATGGQLLSGTTAPPAVLSWAPRSVWPLYALAGLLLFLLHLARRYLRRDDPAPAV